MRSSPATLRAVVTALFRRKWTLVLSILAINAGALAYLTLATPKFQSSAELVIRFGDRSVPMVDRLPSIEMTPADRREVVMANSELLQAPELLRATIESFGLGSLYPDIVADPPARWSVMDEAVRVLQANMSVDVGLQNNVITLSILHPDRALAPRMVAKLIDLYIAREAEVYRDPQIPFQRESVAQAELRLATAQHALEEFKTGNAITDFDQEVIGLIKRRGDADTALRAAQASLGQAERRSTDLRRMLEGVPERLSGTASGEKYRSLDEAQARLGELRSKQSQMLATYAPDSPALQQVQAGVANAEQDVRARRAESGGRSAPMANPVFQTLQTDYFHAVADAQSGQAPVAVYTRQLAEVDSRLAALQAARGTLSNLTRQVQIADDAYRTLARQFEQAQLKQNLNTQRISSATVLSAPTQPYRTARPRKLITAVAALFASVLLGFGLVLLLEALDDRLATPDQLAGALGVPVLASIPRKPRPTAATRVVLP